MTEDQAIDPPQKRTRKSPRRRMPRKASVTDHLRTVGAQMLTNEQLREARDSRAEADEMTLRERLARALWSRAIAGDCHAVKTIMDYTEIKPSEAARGPAGRVTFVFEEFVAGQARDDKS